MELRLKLSMLTLLVLAAAFAFYFAVQLEKPQVSATGAVIAASPDDDTVEIMKEDLVKCCTFTNSFGLEDSCYVLRETNCSYCADYCSSP